MGVAAQVETCHRHSEGKGRGWRKGEHTSCHIAQVADVAVGEKVAEDQEGRRDDRVPAIADREENR
jgi:hypothetical protein